MLYTIVTKDYVCINIENYIFIPKDDNYIVEVKYNIMPKYAILFDDFNEAKECLRVLQDNKNKIIFTNDYTYWESKYNKEPKVDDLKIVKLIPEMC